MHTISYMTRYAERVLYRVLESHFLSPFNGYGNRLTFHMICVLLLKVKQFAFAVLPEQADN